jgi:hypothetical protein
MRAMIRSALAFRAVRSVSSNSSMTRSRTVATVAGPVESSGLDRKF